MSGRGNRSPSGHGRLRIRASWAVALIACVVLGALLVGASGPAAAAPSGGSTLPTFATVPSPIAVSATTTALLALSSSSCTTLYSIAADHSVTTYNSIPTTVKKCNEAALAVSPGLGGFPAGEVYVLESDGSVYAIPPSLGMGTLIYSGSTYLAGTYLGLAFDYTGSFGYALIATGGKAGNVVAITPDITSTTPASSSSAYSPAYLASFGAYVEGPAVAPSTYTGYSGSLVVASEGNANVYTLAPGSSAPGAFSTQWKNSEAVSFVPTLACSYSGTGDSYFIADTSGNAVLGIPSSTFAGFSNSALLLSEYKGVGVDVVPATGSTTSVLPIPGTLDGASYVACPIGVTQKIDLSSSGLGGSQGTTIDPNMNLIGFDPAQGWLVGTDPFNVPDSVFFVDGVSGNLISQVAVGLNAASVAYSPKTGTLYLAGTTPSGEGYLTLLNATTLQPLGPVPTLLVEQNAGALAAVFNNQNTKLYVACQNGNVDVFSLTNNPFPNQNQFVALPSGAVPTGIVADPVDGNVYVVGNVDGSHGYVWEIHAFDLVGTLAVGSDAVAIDVNPSSGVLYVALEGSNAVVFVGVGDVLTGLAVDIASPVGVAYNARSGYLYVDSSTGSMTIFDGTSTVATFSLGTSPGALVYDPVNGIVYVCAYVPDPRIILGTSG